MGVKFEVTSGFDRKWAPNVVPVEGNWVDDKDEYINTTKAWIKSGFKVWWMIRSFGGFFLGSSLRLLPVLTGNGPRK